MKYDATIKTVTEVGLAVDENLRILKHVIEPEHKTGQEKRICVVTGTHGDELEGQYVCYELNRILREQKEHLKGIVEIYPALNPLGVDSISRGIPMFDLDMNRIFPGKRGGIRSRACGCKNRGGHCRSGSFALTFMPATFS